MMDVRWKALTLVGYINKLSVIVLFMVGHKVQEYSCLCFQHRHPTDRSRIKEQTMNGTATQQSPASTASTLVTRPNVGVGLLRAA